MQMWKIGTAWEGYFSVKPADWKLARQPSSDKHAINIDHCVPIDFQRPDLAILPRTLTMARNFAFSAFICLQVLTEAREIVFPPVSGYSTEQTILGGYNQPDITQGKFAGLTTYANLPYVHCLAPKSEEVEPFDIAILGAPFDTVSPARYDPNCQLKTCRCIVN